MNGIVVAIDEQLCRVRVEFPDRDNLVSDWLPVGQKKTLGDEEYWLPDLDTQVVCLMDEHCEAGVVLCAIYSDLDPPPVANKDLFYRRFKDGTIIQYDRATHKLSVDVKGDIEATATGKADVTIDGKTTYISKGKIDLDGVGAGTMGGVLQQKHHCQFHGNPFETRGTAATHFSSTVKASKE